MQVLPISDTRGERRVLECISNLKDLKPEVIIFNVEVFNALFVYVCINSSMSISTTLVIMAVDFAHACVSLRDPRESARDQRT